MLLNWYRKYNLCIVAMDHDIGLHRVMVGRVAE